MPLTYNAIVKWLTQHAADCTPAQLNHLDELVFAAKTQAAERESRSKAALEKATEVARAAGFASVEDLLRASNPNLATLQATLAPPNARKPVLPRKPHLDPLDPAPAAVYSLTKYAPDALPAWAKARLAEGWSIEELSYKRHRAALKARGLPLLYDPAQVHAQLIAKEPPRFQRKPR